MEQIFVEKKVNIILYNLLQTVNNVVNYIISFNDSQNKLRNLYKYHFSLIIQYLKNCQKKNILQDKYKKIMMASRQYIQNSVTIQNLQNYITQLTVYINENNVKYTKNLQTLKKFYQDQISNLNNKNSQLQDEKLIMKNQLLTVKDLLLNRQKQNKQLTEKYFFFKEENEEYREKLNKQRKQIDNLYEQINEIKKEFQKDLNYQEQKLKEVQNQNNQLILKIKEKQQDISSLKKDIFKLQDQLAERYSLPEKLKDIQIQSMKNKTLASTLSSTKNELQRKIDYLNNDLQILRKENQKLQSIHDTAKINNKFQIQQLLNKQKTAAYQKQKRLQSTIQKQLFEIRQLQNAIKSLKKQNTELEKKLNEFVQECKILKNRILNHDNEKDKYIEEYRKMKVEYEEVIKNLEDTIPIYQKKNFDLEQQNKDLNVQLDGLRDLLNELKSINDLMPLKQEYRKIAELQLLARKDYQFYRSNNQNNHIQKEKNHQISVVQKDQNDFRWDKLLSDIENIKIV